VPEVRLLIVLLPDFGAGVCLLLPGWVLWCCPVCPGAYRIVPVRLVRGMTHSRCQQVTSASFHGLSGLT
jgi:hypothetical protein